MSDNCRQMENQISSLSIVKYFQNTNFSNIIFCLTIFTIIRIEANLSFFFLTITNHQTSCRVAFRPQCIVFNWEGESEWSFHHELGVPPGVPVPSQSFYNSGGRKIEIWEQGTATVDIQVGREREGVGGGGGGFSIKFHIKITFREQSVGWRSILCPARHSGLRLRLWYWHWWCSNCHLQVLSLLQSRARYFNRILNIV